MLEITNKQKKKRKKKEQDTFNDNKEFWLT